MRYRELVTAEEIYLKANGWTRRRIGRSGAVCWIPPKTLDPGGELLLGHDDSLKWQKQLDREQGGTE